MGSSPLSPTIRKDITLITFLPYQDFYRSCYCLDLARLRNQRSEARFIYRIITGEWTSKRWSNSVGVRMWYGYEKALSEYYNACLKAFEDRGYKNITLLPIINNAPYIIPDWFYSEKLYSSHRQTLLSKNQSWYSQYNWKEQPVYKYYWPK